MIAPTAVVFFMVTMKDMGYRLSYTEAEEILKLDPGIVKPSLLLDVMELKRLVEILTVCINRRFPPDSIIENALNQVESQCAVVVGNLKSKGEVNGSSKTRKTR